MSPLQLSLLGGFFAVLTALGLLIFPGHTFLLSDTQIYIPLFEHLRTPTLFPNELIREGAHLSYTIYDEVTLTLSRLTGLDFETTLFAQQFLYRWLGYLGAFALARAAGFSVGASVLSSALLWLGAFIYGPAIITTEFEPVPRGFAVPLLVAALGALAHQRHWLASTLFAIAFLYHFPAVWPFFLLALLSRQWRLLAIPTAAALLLFISARLQPGIVEAQPFFSFIDPAHRVIMQTRAAYNWISLWPTRYILHFLLTSALAYAAYLRLRDILPAAVQPFFRWLPAVGLATMPLSWLLLENLGWALFPQLQPMRALLYCHLLCQWLGTLAAARDFNDGKYLRSFLWLFVPLTLALRGDILQFPPGALQKQFLLTAVLAAAILIARRWPRREWAFAASLLAAAFFGEILQARAYTPLETPALQQLSQWAKDKTPRDAVFLFPDLGRRLEPGIFRARSTRTVYTCWKQGGQVNYFPIYANTWWKRWNDLLAPSHPPLDFDDLRRRGIQYLVYTKDSPDTAITPAYASPQFRVYQLNP